MAERDDEGFLARWSRRKRAARETGREPNPNEPPAPPGTAEAAPAEPPRDIADLPDPDTLDASSDFSVFLRKDVPIDTHRQALRRLWRLDPIYNRLDGLDDYCEDYTDQAKVVKNLRTAYKVGRGLLERIGDDAAPSKEAPPSAPAEPTPADEPARIAAAPAEPMPPEQSEPRMPPLAEPEPLVPKSRSHDPRRPRPLPKRG